MTVRSGMTRQTARHAEFISASLTCHAELVSASESVFYFPLSPNDLEHKPVSFRSRIKFGMTARSGMTRQTTRHAEFISASLTCHAELGSASECAFLFPLFTE